MLVADSLFSTAASEHRVSTKNTSFGIVSELKYPIMTFAGMWDLLFFFKIDQYNVTVTPLPCGILDRLGVGEVFALLTQVALTQFIMYFSGQGHSEG